jgi:flagellar basal-body rod modification protein FlgD
MSTEAIQTIQTVDVPASGANGPRRTPKQELGKNDFLMLLTKQLQHQDPLQPADNMQFVSQMANFSTLEQITNMTKVLEQNLNKDSGGYKAQAINFLGAEIYAVRPDQADPIHGVVNSVKFVDGEAIFRVGDTEVKMEHIQDIAIPELKVAQGATRQG